MLDLIFGVVLAVGLTILWLGLGAVVLVVMDFHAERALSLLSGRSDWRKGLVLLLWPLTVLAVLLLQFHPRYRGSNHDSIEYPDPFA